MSLIEGFSRAGGTPLRLPAAIEHPRFVPICFAVYIVLRLAPIYFLPILQVSDNLWYFHRAVAIASGHGYSENNIPTAFWPVGWPGLLGIVFWLTTPSPVIGQLINLACAAGIFILTLRLARTLFKDERAGRLAVLILTFYPNQIGYIAILSTELFYAALLMLAVDLLVSGAGRWRLLASGAVFGIAALSKTQTLLVPAVLFVGWWALSPRSRRALPQLAKATTVYAAMALVILPWTARNYHVFGQFVLVSTNGGLVLLQGNNPSATGGPAEDAPLVTHLPRGVADQVAADHLASSLALAWISRHPGSAIALAPKKMWQLWGRDGEAEWAYQAGYDRYAQYWYFFRTLRIINQLYYLAVVMLALAPIFWRAQPRDLIFPEWLTGYILSAYTTLTAIVFFGVSRYHFAMVPWLAMYAGLAMIQLAAAARSAARIEV